MLAGICFFVRGLDDATDYLRFYHGMWHFCVPLSFYFFFGVDRSLSKRDLKV